MPILYNMRTIGKNQWSITKFDDDFNVESTYTLVDHGKGPDAVCDCPAGLRPTCRHRQMLPVFALKGAIDTGMFYCYEGKYWVQPLQEQAEPEPAPEPSPPPPPKQTPLRRLKL